jgi:hypothetical protein
MAYLYCTATNTGKGFFTHQDRNDFYLSDNPGQVWVVGDNNKGTAWVSRVSGTVKTKAEAQAIVDAQIAEDQTAWNALPSPQKEHNPAPSPDPLP